MTFTRATFPDPLVVAEISLGMLDRGPDLDGELLAEHRGVAVYGYTMILGMVVSSSHFAQDWQK